MGVFEVRIAAEDNHLALIALLPRPLDHLQAVEPRHANIQQNHVRLVFQKERDRLLSISSLSHNLISKGTPIYDIPQSLTDFLLIVGDQNVQHHNHLPVKIIILRKGFFVKNPHPQRVFSGI